MIRDIEILNEIIEIRKKTEFLKNPLINDFCGSHFWGDIDERLKQIEVDIEKNINGFKIIKNE
jgi:hypothetical protein